ncbi:class I SAM-dependent methyltransferase [Deinococcus koreensis]|uniref:SAM-dependent methyltransferase n=1 Tax=Deinococcus koreensis TaxID=2054903 RepID=A0A2K3UZW1_9DEIO|nr:methyltransferase domain-containing protein [Deinococcus koreensis]PNY82052.1 SAM-dependent methyltransferase [Deinococcus koreensis]
MTTHRPADVAAQYATEQHLRTRIETHRRYTVGPDLEDAVDARLVLHGDEALLDVGTGPGDFPGRLRAAGHRGRLVGADLSAGMVATAQANHPGVEYVQASADALPFADQTFDVLTARHMLYHVPDVPAALSEFRRVLRPGGRFLAVTNPVGYMAELWEVLTEAAEAEPALTGLRDSRGGFAAAFSEVNGANWVRAAFGNVEVSFTDAALVFPTAELVLTYVESLMAWQRLEAPERERGHAVLRPLLEGRFRDGPWRVSKRMALLSAVRG